MTPLASVYQRLFDRFGPQHWWPARSRLEIVVGALLTQNTAWTNVEKAIERLRQAGLLDAAALPRAPVAVVAEAVRPAGYFNVKAQRLVALAQALEAEGGLEGLDGWETATLRVWLLSRPGVGPETADAVLLYAFQRPVFVVDAYARRIFGRLELIRGDEPYEVLRRAWERELPGEAALLNEFHALLVRLGKEHCRTRARCGQCPLVDLCPSAV